MMRHVSVFRVKPEYRTPEIISMLEQRLLALPATVPTVIDCEIGVKQFILPSESPEGKIKFYDIIQIITFATQEDCLAYPATQGHQDLLHATSKYMEDVVGLDYPV